jgi:flagellar biosynthesis protein FlhB
MRTAAALGLVLAVLDYSFQRHKIHKGMLMTKQEIREETKTTDGNPQIKQAIKSRQFKMSRMRMMAEVARADAVVVNPTHVSVALRYDALQRAPRVVAKGQDDTALRIREEAVRNGVPLIEDIPLARTLYAACEVGAEIPGDLYEAVARLLAFLFTLRASGRLHQLGGGPLRAPASLLSPQRTNA